MLIHATTKAAAARKTSIAMAFFLLPLMTLTMHFYYKQQGRMSRFLIPPVKGEQPLIDEPKPSAPQATEKAREQRVGSSGWEQSVALSGWGYLGLIVLGAAVGIALAAAIVEIMG